MFNGHNSPTLKSSKLLNGLAELRGLTKTDLHQFLQEDYTSFNTLNVGYKHIPSTNRLTLTISKNSAQSFYLGKPPSPKPATKKQPELNDDCLQDAQNCEYFNLFSSKEKRLHTRFTDLIEANFFCSCPPKTCPHQHLFLTGTYNTSKENHYAWTRNWDPTDPCWDAHEKPWLKKWAQTQDPQAEPMKVHIPPTQSDPSQFSTIKKHFAQLVKDINRIFKPSNWKWVVVFELQKCSTPCHWTSPKSKTNFFKDHQENNCPHSNQHPCQGNWHWHLLSTPFIPYSHKCVLNQSKSKACWDCRTYLNSLWTHGRVESRSLDKRAAGRYLAKYLSKSFHLRSLYEHHGLNNKQRTYHFYQNLYNYEQKPVIFIKNYRLDATTGQKLNNNQHIFRLYNYQTEQISYFYRTNRKLIGKVARPEIKKKNYRLGARSLNPLPLTKLAHPDPKKPALLLSPPKKVYHQDFQQFLITHLLLLCKTARASKIPLEKKQVPKEGGECSNSIYQHFETKLILHFTFSPENVPKVKEFFNQLDTYAQEYDMEESKDFFDPRFKDPIESRNAYLNNWQLNIADYQPHCKQPLFERERNPFNYNERTAM